MEVGEDTLYLQLHKLSGAVSEDALDQLVSAIWQSRKTGLRGHRDRSHFQSLLSLPSLADLDPVLACLRSLIRKCAASDGFDAPKLFPPDLPLHLRQSLSLLLQKYQTLWREDISRDQQRSLPRTSVAGSALPSLTPFSAGLWPRHDDPIGSSIPIENNGAQLAPMAPQTDFCPLENLGSLPCLKSMTWTMETGSSQQTKRVALITLKLQDYTKSPSGETEVKFQLTKDTLEAMLRSLTYINDQLSGTVGLEPMQKKQKQTDTSA